MNPLFGFNDYLSQLQSDYDKNIAAATNRAAATPEGKLEKSFIPKFALPSLSKIASNPIINMGVDMASNLVQSAVQGLIQSALKKGASFVGKFDSAVSGFFSTLALVSTAGVEVAMALARGNAQLIVDKIKAKDAVIVKLQEEVVALNNAVDILLNTTPFFSAYLKKLYLAYALVDKSNKNLKSVSATLKAAKYYNQSLYSRAVGDLESAVELILPDKTANTSSIRSGKLNDVIKDRVVAA
ncbi:MAG: hypothetical protein EBU84_17155, partial [Actinobacteria bacterium]|nr:hypothetical protein [Actinomycetota bacterium]